MTLAIALLVGFGGTISALTEGRQIAAREYGVWYGWPDAGAEEIDPYLRADLARSGNLQLGRAEGVSFHAIVDDQGGELNGRCSYTVSGTVPKSSAWTIRVAPRKQNGYSLNASNGDGSPTSFLVNNEIQFGAKGKFTIDVSPSPKPGNWLKSPEGAFELTLNVYDSNAFVVVGNETVKLPLVRKGSCS